jgi:hypothetical protein
MFRHGSKSEMSTIIKGFGIGDGFSTTEWWNQKKKGAGNLGQSINRHANEPSINYLLTKQASELTVGVWLHTRFPRTDSYVIF